MSHQAEAWSVRLADIAGQDFLDIYEWTAVKFGTAQADTYADALSFTIDALRAGPQAVGVRRRDVVSKGLWSLSVKINRRLGSHQVYFRVVENVREIVILRILHNAMEPTRHLRN